MSPFKYVICDQVCNHPYLMEGTEPRNKPLEELNQLRISASGKLQLFDQMLAYLHARGHRVLVFSQFTSMLDVLEAYMLSRYSAGGPSSPSEP